MKKNITIIILVIIIIALIIFMYYKKTYYHFELNGKNEIVLVNDEEYQELGFRLVDYNNNVLNNNVKIENNIDINNPGKYEVKYYYNDKLLGIRNVIVKKITFKLNGDDIVYVDYNNENNKYQELGVIALDENGVDFSNQVEITGNVNNHEVGVYEIKYLLKIDEYEKELRRTVHVEKMIHEISISEDKIDMYVNDTKELNVIYSPTDATNNNLTWESSDTNIVDVNDGIVMAKKVGTAIITVKTANNIESKCTIDVIKKKDSITVNYKKVSFSGEIIKADVKNISGSDMNITYYSDNSCKNKIAGVPKEIGTYYVTIKSLGNDEYKEDSLSCTKAIQITKAPVQLRVGSFNMGQYKCGTGKYSCKPGYKDFANYFNSSKADIIGLQEAEDYKTTERAAKEANYNNNFFKSPASTIGIISKYSIISKMFKELNRCKENRGIEKIVIEVNGVNISFYNTHFSYQAECVEKHFADAASIIKNDSNPSIIVGDYNTVSKSYYEKYFKPLGYEIAAYDDTTTNMWGKVSYCDAVYVNSKGHIDIIGNETINAFNKVSDHNLVVATLKIY